MKIVVGILAASIVGASSAIDDPHGTPAIAVKVFRSLDEFNASGGRPPVAITFDDVAPGDIINGKSIGGVRFAAVQAQLQVVRGDETFTSAGYQAPVKPGAPSLACTTGAQLLSPGGEELAPGPRPDLEDDDVIMTFDPPVAAFGFDHISQLADGNSYTHIEVFDAGGKELYSGTVEIGPVWSEKRHSFEQPKEVHPGGIVTADFWGIVSISANIARIVIDERDDDNVNADSNIGIDTIRCAPARCALAADVNGDGAVDRTDLSLLRADLGRASLTIEHDSFRWNPSDIDRDGTVDTNDLARLLEAIGQ
jgi:hypothetical protein